MKHSIEIVLIEDSEQDVAMTIRALRKYNFSNNLLHLKSGEEALDFLFARGTYSGRDAGDLPKIILLDLNSSKTNGLEVLREIKSDENLKIVPVVVLTASSEDPDIKECYRLGANSYIVKPLAFSDFVEAVSELGLYWLLLNKTLSKVS